MIGFAIFLLITAAILSVMQDYNLFRRLWEWMKL